MAEREGSGGSDGLSWALTAFADGTLASRYERYRRYYEGDQDLAFATPKFESAFGRLFREFAYNRCASVVDAIADRLQVTGFSVVGGEGGEGARTRIAELVSAIWERNRMDVRAGETHQEALLAGDGYLVVWPERQPDGTEAVELWPQEAACMRVRYDPDRRGRLLLAAKAWRGDDGHHRVTVYAPDRIEKYRSRAKQRSGLPTKPDAFERHEVAGEPWPVPNPWGQVPVIHFANNGRPGRYGVSELRPVLALQDALNKAVADMMVAMEFAAFAQRWATGVDVQVDPATGKPVQPWDAGVDKIITVADAAARFGQFEAAALPQFLAVQDSFDLKIARATNTPAHYILMTGDFPSGEALKTAEAPFVRKILDRQRAFGNAWEDALRLALRMEGVEPPPLSCQWESAEPRSEQEALNLAIAKKQVGYSQEQILRELGLSPAQIAHIQEEKEAAIARQQQLFDRGLTAEERMGERGRERPAQDARLPA
jgi:hypothetical protein